MEALWNLEDKWKLTTRQALVVLLIIVSFTAVGIVVATFFKKRNNKVVCSQESSEGMSEEDWRVEDAVKRLLMGSLRWSGVKKWEETPPQPLLAAEVGVTVVGRQSHNSESPVWQRPILMGEKCELPRFSGLILYDESGQLLHDSLQVQPASVVDTKTTLKDLL